MAVDAADRWLHQVFESGRLRLEVPLRPAQGARFQPAGYPDLGAATYRVSTTTEDRETQMVLVESPQSVANRLEAVCWDAGVQDVVEELKGLPYVRVLLEGDGTDGTVTASLLEAHRLNSPYIMDAVGEDGEPFRETLRKRTGVPARKKKAKADGDTPAEGDGDDDLPGVGIVDPRRIAQAVYHYDPNAVLHGVFLTELDGRARLQRALSGFVEAVDAHEALSGGVKLDRVHTGGDTKKGYGNVPYARIEFVARDIRAYFSLDTALLHSYGLPPVAVEFLVVLAVWKIRRFLRTGLRLRTACDFEVAAPEVEITVPRDTVLPSETELAARLRHALGACAGHWADPPVTVLRRALTEASTVKRGARGRR